MAMVERTLRPILRSATAFPKTDSKLPDEVRDGGAQAKSVDGVSQGLHMRARLSSLGGFARQS